MPLSCTAHRASTAGSQSTEWILSFSQNGHGAKTGN